ncbi:MAG: hypothetical protein U1F52_05320 [Burkholderiales bacterium]|mgnify:CR=1 FL=1
MFSKPLISVALFTLLGLSASIGRAADEAAPAAEHDHSHGAPSEGSKTNEPAKKKDAVMCKMKGCKMMQERKSSTGMSASMLERRIQLLEKRMEVLEMTMRMMHDQPQGNDEDSMDMESK